MIDGEGQIRINGYPQPFIFAPGQNLRNVPTDVEQQFGDQWNGWRVLRTGLSINEGEPLEVFLHANNGKVKADAVRLNRIVSSEYEYDGNGNQTSNTDTRGSVTTYVYDELNRNRQTISADPDSTGNTNKSLVTEQFYDGYGNVIREIRGHVTDVAEESSMRLTALTRSHTTTATGW